MPDTYDISDSQREALERARANPRADGVIDLDAMMEEMGKTWGEAEPSEPPEEPAEPVEPEEQPPEEEWARMKYEMRQNATRPPAPSPLLEKMASVGWAPPEKASPWSPGWQELHEKLGGPGAPPAAEQASPQPTDPETLLKQVAELDAKKAEEEEKAAQDRSIAKAAEQTPPAPPPEAALLQQHNELEAAQKAEAEKKAAEERAAKEKAAAEAPKPPPGPDWDAMLKQLQDAEHARDTQQNVGAMLHAAAPGFQAPPGAGEGAVASAKAAMEMEQRKHKEAADLLAQTKTAALSDPKSAESQRAREAFIAQFPEAAKVMKLENLSANEISGLAQREAQIEHYRAMDAATKAKEAAAAAKQAEKEAADRAKQAEKDRNLAAEAKSLDEERGLILADPRAKKLGLTPEMLDGLDRHGLDKFRAQLDTVKLDKPKGPPHNAGVKIEPGKIETVPDRRPGYRDLIKGIADGRLQAPQPGTKFGAEVISDVLAFKPDFDATNFGAYKKVRDQQAAGKDVIAIDVALEHLATAKRLIPANADTQYVNRVKQAIATGTGDAEFQPFIAASSVAAHELAKVYGIEDQEGKREVLHQLASVQSPEQLHAVFDTFIELIEGKKKGLEHQRERVAPKGGEQPAGEKKEHGAVVRETRRFRQYADGFTERK